MVDCSICLDELHDRSEVIQFRCQHKFHYHCVFNMNGIMIDRCPVCRGEIPQYPKNATVEQADSPTDFFAVDPYLHFPYLNQPDTLLNALQYALYNTHPHIPHMPMAPQVTPQ